MRHIFVINPKAGKGRKYLDYLPKIENYCRTNSIEFEIYITQSKGDGTEFVRRKTREGVCTRFYACGGDGTLYEVVNGMAKDENSEVALMPMGSGNDFIRIFGGKVEFLNPENLINGETVEIDLIKCGDKYAINQCSMGLDAEIAGKQEQFKKLPFISGVGAYYPAILYCLMRKIRNVFTVRIDDTEELKGEFLFCIAANSRWYGGGYHSAPLAEPDDGLLDFVLVKKTVGRLGLLPLINRYKAGEHLDWEFTLHSKGKKITIMSEDDSAVNLDGECHYAKECTFEVVERAIKFVIPQGINYHQ